METRQTIDEIAVREGITQVLAIAHDRARTLEALKQALLANDEKEIRVHAAKLCGLNN